ncbi:hypothetical protein ACFSMW_06795 [Virgibacillus halophilus]|uniref:YqaI-like protein n=1 Tax=Tigheibacillus halophilus TaxID=361280 RepID=A0ABU5C794_9BACI|nr:hypothetical protein [Virgibacillus halophilus]
MLDLEHPMITRMERTGIPYSAKREAYGKDPFENEVWPGDQILMLDDDFYLVDELPAEAIEILERHGASYRIAQ